MGLLVFSDSSCGSYLLLVSGLEVFDMNRHYPTCAQGKQCFSKRKVLAVASEIICFEKRCFGSLSTLGHARDAGLLCSLTWRAGRGLWL